MNTSGWQPQLGPLGDGPVRQFAQWYERARTQGIVLPERAALATASADGKPSVRFVLVRGYSEQGLAFFTDYSSRKGRELAANPWAALAFHWRQCGLQVRAEGRVERLSADLSDRYFASRPAGSRASAIVSSQSEPVGDYKPLTTQAQKLLQDGEEQLQRPDSWGGYLLSPDTFEFWTERADRMHEREQWMRQGDQWTKQWLMP